MQPSDDAPDVLIVDDDPETCELLATLLSRQGYDTAQARSGAECLALVARHPVPLLLLDVVMPGLDGFAVCEALDALPAQRRPAVILLTGHDGFAMRQKGMRQGVCEFLTKPVDPDVLLDRVRTQLRVAELARRLERVEQMLDVGRIPVPGR
jgi:putative two-component system response regulator